MGQATYYSGTDRSIGSGSYNFYFNPTGDTLNATVTNVSYRFKISYAGGQKVDLGDVDIYLYSPDGERHTIYNNFDGFGADTDDHNDSDSANDYDIYFDGSGGESTFSAAFDGAQVNGNWRLWIDNDTGKTLTMYYFGAVVDYQSAPDMIVEDIKFSGDREVGERVKIEATLKNIGETDYFGIGKNFDVEYYVNGKLVGTDSVSYGLNAGQSNIETFSYRVKDPGTQRVEVKVLGIDDEGRTDNNSRTESFWAKAPDLVVKDIKIYGDVKTGEEVKIKATLANIGGADYGGLLEGGFELRYYVEKTDGTQRYIGKDDVSFGLTAGQSDTESIKYTLRSSDTGKFTVRIVDTEDELNTGNNRRIEWAGENNKSAHTVSDSLEHVKIGALFSRAVYGEDRINDSYTGSDDNGLGDRYDNYFKPLGWKVLKQADFGRHFVPDENARFNGGGLFEGKADALIPSWDAQSLVAVGETKDGSKTLVLTFRGTDSADSKLNAFINGQAFSGDGLYHHYNAHKPLVEAAISYANTASNGIDKVIVTGHSLGGSMADVFASIDAQRLRDDIDLTVVSLASAGVDKTLYSHTEVFDGFEKQHDYGVVKVDGSSVSLKAADHYIGISHNMDAVTFAERVDLDTIDGYVGNNVLRNNINFDSALTRLYLPNLDNSERDAGGLFPKGFGTHHVDGLYWAHISMLADDPLAGFYNDTQRISFGLTNYDQVKDIDGSTLAVFQDYTRLGEAGYDNDNGSAALLGSGRADFILGLSGNDRIEGGGGKDLLSGGTGNDVIRGGDGDDRIDGGSGNDSVDGGAGIDFAWLGSGDDNYTDHATDTGRDTVFGGSGNDLISTGAGNDLLNGGDGNDTLEGGNGGDRIIGGLGEDLVNGGSGSDRVDGGGGNDRIKTSAGNDKVVGGEGRDKVFLGIGDDTFTDTAQKGIEGRDKISGGSGSDTFIFRAAMSVDRITDYETGKDELHLGKDLWDDGLTARQLIKSVASVETAGVVLKFGDGDKLILEGLTTTNGLAGDLVLV